VNTFLFVQKIAKRWHFFKKKNILSRISFFDTKIRQNPQIFF
jgi:hypothetical protein